MWFGLARESTSNVGPKVIYNSSATNGDYIETLMTPTEIVEVINEFITVAEIAESEYLAGRACDEGDGVPKNDTQAIRWWTRAAERRYQHAMYDLGWVYANDESVHKDYIKAHMWFTISTECQHPVDGYCLFNPAGGVNLERMTPEEIAEAERLAREWIESHAS
jgi:Sel1 repeat